MSLQTQATINNTGTAFAQIWTNWRQPAGPANNRILSRQNAFSAIVAGFNFLSPPAVSFQNLGPNTLGGFNWTDWSLELTDAYTSQEGITLEDFILLCRTVYHECRHCEQVYRCAQGLACYRVTTPPPANSLTPPDISKAEIIQMASGGAGGVTARIAAFSGDPLTQPAARVKLITKVLNIPAVQATAAEASANAFAPFLLLAKPAWFKRNTVMLEVEEWMRSISKSSLFGMTMFVEQNAQDVNDMYLDLPVEIDAHKIEDAIAARTELTIGHTVAASGNQPRTNVGLFGA